MTEPDTLTPDVAEPAFVARARRILAGDVRPDDYLPVTPEVRRRVERFMEWARARGNGVPLAPEVEPRQLRQELVSFHHGGVNIAYLKDDVGILVLGVGLEQAGYVVRNLLTPDGPLVTVDVPDLWNPVVEC